MRGRNQNKLARKKRNGKEEMEKKKKEKKEKNRKDMMAKICREKKTYPEPLQSHLLYILHQKKTVSLNAARSVSRLSFSS